MDMENVTDWEVIRLLSDRRSDYVNRVRGIDELICKWGGFIDTPLPLDGVGYEGKEQKDQEGYVAD